MSYNTQEISVAAGAPVELYRFALGQQVSKAEREAAEIIERLQKGKK